MDTKTIPVGSPHQIEGTYLRSNRSVTYRFLWLIYGSLSLLWKIPMFALFSVFHRHPLHSWGRAFFIKIIQAVFQLQCDFGFQFARLTVIPKEGSRSRFVWIPAAPIKYRVGAAAHANKKGEAPTFEDVPAYWYAPSSRHIKSQNKEYTFYGDGGAAVLLHFHGGGYVAGTAGEDIMKGDFLSRAFVQGTSMDMLAVEYRLAGYYSFPAQLQDAISAYVYLHIQLCIPAEKIIITGDSAGGNLAISFLKYLQEHKEIHHLPNPGGAILLSPWLEPSSIRSLKASKMFDDIINLDFALWGAKALTFGHNEDFVHSPLIAPINDQPDNIARYLPEKTFISAGGTEWFKDEIDEYVRKAWAGRVQAGIRPQSTSFQRDHLKERSDGKTYEQNGITYDVTEGCPHNFGALPLVCQPEIKRLFARIGQWLGSAI